MLGRTDSRSRLLVLLVVFGGRLAGADRPGSAYWQVARSRPAGLARPPPRRRSRLETPSQRGDIYDRTGTVVLATTVQRERLVAAPDQLTPEQRRATVAELTRDPRARRGGRGSTLRERLASDSASTSILRHGLERTTADRIRAAIAAKRRLFGLSLEPEPERVYPQAGGGPDTTLAAHLLGFVNRDGGRPVRRRAALPGRRSPASPGSSSPQRDASGRRDARATAIVTPGRDARHGPAPDDRRRAPARGSSRSSSRPGSPTRPSASRRSSWTRTPARSTPRRPIPSYDANDYRAIAATRSRRGSSTRSSSTRLRARLGVQDDDRDRRARARDGHADDPDQGRRDAPASTAAGPRSTTPTARAWAG